jgi:hypothetical protein
MERQDYDAQAEEWLQTHGLRLKLAFKPNKCPGWPGSGGVSAKWDCPRCGGIHGECYRVTLRRLNGTRKPKSISFDFWGSRFAKQEARRPTHHDVLVCISGDATMPTDCGSVKAELGENTPCSQAKKIADFAKRLQAFLADEELDTLAEIR